MPLPPPPRAAFTSSGNPTRSAAARTAAASFGSGNSAPGTTGTPARSAVRRALTLSPMTRIADAGGPTNVMPAASHASRKAGFSERKP